MTEDTATSPDTTTATAEASLEVATTKTEELASQVSEGEEGEEQERPQPGEETEEVDWEDGRKYRIPKTLKDAFLKNADYTRKTQELAEQRKALDTERSQQVERNEAMEQKRAQLWWMGQRIQALRQVDWNRIGAEDPVAAGRLTTELTLLSNEHRALSDHLKDEEAKALDTQRQRAARQIEEGRAALAREIPHWSPELAKKLSDFGVKRFNFSAQEMRAVIDPRAINVLHLAYLGQQLIDKQKAAAKQVATPKVEPVPQVTSGRSPAPPGPRANQSVDEWMNRRNAQLQKKRA